MKIGFIGAGNMGSAIINGIVSKGIADPMDIIVTDSDTTKVSELGETSGVRRGISNELVAQAVDILFLCVKPYVIYDVINEIKDTVTEKTLIVSIAAGQSLERLMDAFGNDKLRIIRVMPNTPALVGEGMTAIVRNDNATSEDARTILDIFDNLGKAEIISERLMNAATAISGSSPAYVFMLIEAMADAAVQGGMPRFQAYKFAAQAVLGSAKMVLETDMHPAELKDMVCSPSGTTIDAVAVLEECGMRGMIMKAVKACIDKAKSM